ncbi:MAG TPA: helix-turn-helix domain-containing protein [Gaiellales bacterium]|jgi:AcrR family transcriptional regulator|nr:helix-turn-helix domain-containing protein [Gaiellales bacterium]
MEATRSYRSRSRTAGARETRERIVAAVRELLRERRFHESTVEQVAARAKVSRATVYQHFRSRIDLVDAICETFDVNPALMELRRAVVLPDPRAALSRTIALSVRFWDSEDAILSGLYGVVSIDPAARDLVGRQRADRRREMRRLARQLQASGALRTEVSAARALDVLMVLTSYETYRELREARRSPRRLTAELETMARALLL